MHVGVCSDESRLSSSVSYELGADAQKANIIASQAARDSEDIVSASRRHDRDFLHDVAEKMVCSYVALPGKRT